MRLLAADCIAYEGECRNPSRDPLIQEPRGYTQCGRQWWLGLVGIVVVVVVVVVVIVVGVGSWR
jgi:hypothetical protein